MEHAQIIATDTLVLVRATLPHATITEVTIEDDAVHVTGKAHNNTFVSTIPLHVHVSAQEAIIVGDNDKLTLLIPREDMK